MSVVQTKRVERQGNDGGYGVAERARGWPRVPSTFQQPLTASRLVWITIPPRNESSRLNYSVGINHYQVITCKISKVKVAQRDNGAVTTCR